MFAARMFTALAVIGLFAFPIVRGWDVVKFSVAEVNASDSDEPGIFQPWVDVPGLAFSAHDAALTAIANSRGETRTAKLRKEIAEILSVKPVSSGYWLSLTKLQFNPEQGPRDDVLEPLAMSVLTGPNEGTVMPWRGIFGLSVWGGASPEVRRRTIMDLAAALPEITEQQRSAAQENLQKQTEDVRQEIRSQLVAAGAPLNRLLQIGL